MKIKQFVLISLCCSLMGITEAQELHGLATEFLNTLSPELKTNTIFGLEDEERYNFNFVPVARKGTTFHDFNETQKEAAMKLLRASLSPEGYRKTSEIMALENILIVLENNRLKMPDGSPMRDVLNYHFSIFGEPSSDKFWGWRFEGHHISLNFVASEKKIMSATPSFLGSNPAIIPSGEQKGKQVLKQETELAFSFVNSLSKAQRAKAIFSEKVPREIITTNKREIAGLESKGISFNGLTSDQKTAFKQLLDVYLNNYEAVFSNSLRSKIEVAGWEQLYFAWAGSLQSGAGHYYRIHGPVLLIEYANTQNNANHVHTVVRDLTNDFGKDVLREHYHKHHKE